MNYKRKPTNIKVFKNDKSLISILQFLEENDFMVEEIKWTSSNFGVLRIKHTGGYTHHIKLNVGYYLVIEDNESYVYSANEFDKTFMEY